MTLITYPTRVHFADDVLEEALYSELERATCHTPLLVAADDLRRSELEDRVQAGLPAALKPKFVTYAPDDDLRMIAQQVVSSNVEPDIIIAFGTARAIELARKCRYGLTKKRQKRMPLYAVPGVDGLPGPCTRNLESWRAGLPSVLICDPTITLNTEPADSQRAFLLSIVRCCESYLATAYNPPADGMALDGLNRCVLNMPKIHKNGGLDLQRELMAASLNAALSQEKGVGPALSIAAVLADTSHRPKEADIARLVLPGLIALQTIDAEKGDALLKVLGQSDVSLDLAMRRILSSVPSTGSLAELGIPRIALDQAAKAATGKAGLSFQATRELLDTIYEKDTA